MAPLSDTFYRFLQDWKELFDAQKEVVPWYIVGGHALSAVRIGSPYGYFDRDRRFKVTMDDDFDGAIIVPNLTYFRETWIPKVLEPLKQRWNQIHISQSNLKKKNIMIWKIPGAPKRKQHLIQPSDLSPNCANGNAHFSVYLRYNETHVSDLGKNTIIPAFQYLPVKYVQYGKRMRLPVPNEYLYAVNGNFRYTVGENREETRSHLLFSNSPGAIGCKRAAFPPFLFEVTYKLQTDCYKLSEKCQYCPPGLKTADWFSNEELKGHLKTCALSLAKAGLASYHTCLDELEVHDHSKPPNPTFSSDLSAMLELPNACVHHVYSGKRPHKLYIEIWSNVDKKWNWRTPVRIKNQTNPKAVYHQGKTFLVTIEVNPLHCLIDNLFSLESYLSTTTGIQYTVVDPTFDWCSKTVQYLINGRGPQRPFVNGACFEQLLIPNYSHQQNIVVTNRPSHQWLLQKARNHPCVVQQDPNLMILYPRHDVKKRQWHNVEEIADFLRNTTTLNITVVKKLGNDLCKQISLFSSAKILLYPHGGHMGNYLWTHPRTHEISFYCNNITGYNDVQHWIPKGYFHLLPANIDPLSPSGRCSFMSFRYLTLEPQPLYSLFWNTELLKPYLRGS